MAFTDDPKIDKNAERSEESVLFVKQLMNLKTGFLCREEHPDYGVDLDVELKNETEGVSGKQFAIQIKSTESVKVINESGDKYVSLKFKTSRLGCPLPNKRNHGKSES